MRGQSSIQGSVELWYFGHRPRVDGERPLQAPSANEGVAEIVKVPNRGHSPAIESGRREVVGNSETLFSALQRAAVFGAESVGR